METAREKILMITDRLGMSTAVAAKAMNIKEETFRKNRRGTESGNYFTQKNYTDLLDFTISELEYLIGYSYTNRNNADDYNHVSSEIKRIFEEFPESRKKKGFSLFDQLKEIVDFMENSDVFFDMELYAAVIDELIEKCSILKDERNIFSIKNYTAYVSKGRKNRHLKWINFTNYRRQQAVQKILQRNITI